MAQKIENKGQDKLNRSEETQRGKQKNTDLQQQALSAAVDGGAVAQMTDHMHANLGASGSHVPSTAGGCWHLAPRSPMRSIRH